MVRKIVSKKKIKAVLVPKRKTEAIPVLERFDGNPILEPQPEHWWESKAAFNPGAIYEDASEEAALARLESAMEEGGVEAMLEVARQYGIPTNIEQ